MPGSEQPLFQLCLERRMQTFPGGIQILGCLIRRRARLAYPAGGLFAHSDLVLATSSPDPFDVVGGEKVPLVKRRKHRDVGTLRPGPDTRLRQAQLGRDLFRVEHSSGDGIDVTQSVHVDVIEFPVLPCASNPDRSDVQAFRLPLHRFEIHSELGGHVSEGHLLTRFAHSTATPGAFSGFGIKDWLARSKAYSSRLTPFFAQSCRKYTIFASTPSRSASRLRRMPVIMASIGIAPFVSLMVTPPRPRVDSSRSRSATGSHRRSRSFPENP